VLALNYKDSLDVGIRWVTQRHRTGLLHLLQVECDADAVHQHYALVDKVWFVISASAN